MEKLFQIQPISICGYLCFAFLGSLFVRIINTYFRSREEDKKLTLLFLPIFLGRGYRKNLLSLPIAADYFIGLILGFLELLAYPILLRSGNAAYIGGWLVFKTVNRWQYNQQSERGTFNRYLLSNALIITIAYLTARFYIVPLK
ncbi:MAG TPA: hypothetical protein ENL09_04845 [Bacteroidetes bacterium]|nr:hypothetical protein [Bacteroidota bacterium]